MAVRRVVNDPRAPYVGSAVDTESNDAGSKVLKRFLDQKGRVCEVGRGELNTKITYISLFNENGTQCYLYPDATGANPVCTPVKP